MSCNWIELPLGDLIELKRGYDLPKSKRCHGNIPIVSSAGISDFHSDSKVQAPGVVTGRYGTIGEVFYIKENFWPLNTTLYVKDFKGNFPEFVYYLLKTFDFHKYSDKAAVPGVNRNHLHMEMVRVPNDYDCQKKIASYLSKLDKKISLNTDINNTLEQMAQAIFKSWFVDFDPVKAKMNGEQPEGMDAATASLFPEKLVESELGLIPEGWEVGDLSDLMDFNPKRTLKKGTIAPYLDMKNMPTSGHLALDIYDREMGSGTKFKNGDSLLARITPCLENGKTAYVDFLEDGQVGWGSTEYIVMRSKSDSYKYFSYYMARFEPFRKFAIQGMTGTSGRQRAQAQTVQTMPFAIPPISILEKFDEFVAPNMQMIKSHGSENRTLAALRDILLPKLLSGEVNLEEDRSLSGALI